MVTRLRAAGAVLLGKTSTSALAYGDVWYGGQTRNPWNLSEGSSGSSAGSAAATAAGMCGFAIGTETLGSIVSPAERCGVVGLRPSFGRISRAAAMVLCPSLDKVGVLARGVADTALVLGAVDETVSALHVGAGASGGVCGSRAQTLSNRLWESLSAHVYVFLHNATLADIAQNQMLPCPALPQILNVVDD